MDQASLSRPGDDLERAGRTASRHPLLQRLARAGLLSRAVVYAIIGGLALALATGAAGGSATDSRGALRLVLGAQAGRHGDAAARSWTAWALELPAGSVLLSLAGAVVVVVGLKQLRRGVLKTFRKDLDLGRMSPRLRHWADRLGTAGFAAQGSVIALMGVFLVQAALERDPGEATGFDGALAAVARQPTGMVLLAVAAVGLLAYAAFEAIEWRYRKLPR